MTGQTSYISAIFMLHKTKKKKSKGKVKFRVNPPK